MRSFFKYLNENCGWLVPSIGMVVGGIGTYFAFDYRLEESQRMNTEQDVQIEKIEEKIKEEADRVRGDFKEVSVSVSDIKAAQARMEGKLDTFLRMHRVTVFADE